MNQIINETSTTTSCSGPPWAFKQKKCDEEIMYGPVMFYKLHGKFKTVTVNNVYLKINF